MYAADLGVRNVGGGAVSLRLLDEVHKELCQLPKDKRMEVVNIMSEDSRGSSYARVLYNGVGEPMGFTAKPVNILPQLYVSLDCDK